MIQQKTEFVSEDILQRQEEYIRQMAEKNALFEARNGRRRRCFTHNYGCQQNVADGEKIDGQLYEMGFSLTENREEADFILYNTCAVREGAEDRVFGNVGAIKHQKRQNKDLVVALCGCMTQQEQVVNRIHKIFPFVNLIFGTHALHRLPELVFRVYEDRKHTVVEIDDEVGYIAEGLSIQREDPYKAWISVMYGCNNFCTYCIVPYVRGRERSRKSEDILKEASELVAKGYKEITLLGQNVNSYGNDREDELDFPELLQALNNIPGDFLIRFMTSHPKDATEKLFDTIASCEKIARYIHLPVQSGNTAVLSRMNRGYSREQYLEKLRYAKEKIPEMTFSSDMIAGFPGETREQFEETLSLISEARYISLFTFIYSKRSGTKAADYDDPVSAQEKSDWLREVITLQRVISREVLGALAGSEMRVLITHRDEETGRLRGQAECMTPCFLDGDDTLIGTLVRVNILRYHDWYLEAVQIDKK